MFCKYFATTFSLRGQQNAAEEEEERASATTRFKNTSSRLFPSSECSCSCLKIDINSSHPSAAFSRCNKDAQTSSERCATHLAHFNRVFSARKAFRIASERENVFGWKMEENIRQLFNLANYQKIYIYKQQKIFLGCLWEDLLIKNRRSRAVLVVGAWKDVSRCRCTFSRTWMSVV